MHTWYVIERRVAMKLTNENYVTEAEIVMRELCSIKDNRGRDVKPVTTSKIRKILAMVSNIYNDARHIAGESLDSEMRGRLQYLKMHVVYEAGRDKDVGRPVRSFIEKAKIIETIDSIGNNKQKLIIFCHYMEALVAYRKYYGGNE